MNSVHFMSEKYDWETPQSLFDKLHEHFHFTLDAAASDSNHKLPRYYTKETDGLAQDWGGERVFCNPPYGNVETGLWTQNVGKKLKNRTHWLYFLSRQEQIENHFMISSITSRALPFIF